MKIFHLPDINNVLHRINTGINGVFPVGAQSEPGDKIPGISSQLFLRTTIASTSAGAAQLSSGVVPAGIIWWIKALTINYSGTVTGRIFGIQMQLGAGLLNIDIEASLPANGFFSRNMDFFLLPGYELIFGVYNAEAGKTMNFDILGVKMNVQTVFS